MCSRTNWLLKIKQKRFLTARDWVRDIDSFLVTIAEIERSRNWWNSFRISFYQHSNTRDLVFSSCGRTQHDPFNCLLRLPERRKPFQLSRRSINNKIGFLFVEIHLSFRPETESGTKTWANWKLSQNIVSIYD